MGEKLLSGTVRITNELRDAIYARADSQSEGIESILRRLLELPSLPERLSVGKALPVGALDVGGTVMIPWPLERPGGLADEGKVAKIKRGIYNYGQATGKRFRMAGSAYGLRVLRVQ